MDADAGIVMYVDRDRWREFSHRAGEKREAPPALVRFSRPLLITSALFLLVVGLLDLV
jgi:hypothetical protein